MNKKQEAPAARFFIPCVAPEVGDLLPDYIAELLTDDAAEAVREHLLVCSSCAEDYRNILGMRQTAQELLAAAVGESATTRARGRGVVRRISDYKK